MQRFFKLTFQILHVLVIPLVFMAFLLLYRPQRMVELLDMGSGRFDFNVVILSCILLGVEGLMRTAFFFLKKVIKLERLTYALWCMGEILVFTAFAAMYMTLMYKGERFYFPMYGTCFLMNLSVLVWPYLLINLWIILDNVKFDANRKEPEPEDMVHFRDENQKLRLAVTAQALLYVEAKENYVTVVYLDGDKISKVVLRSSMRRLEDLLNSHGLRRCHRAYYINPTHIKALRKDTEGFHFADLDSPSCPSIPVSKTYYEEIAALI